MPHTRILTAGSCFAQHVGPALRAAGCTVIDEEPAPPDMPYDIARRFSYGIFSARYGNIYTLRQFRQLIEEAAGTFEPARPVWRTRDGRFIDAMRPGVEPDGLGTSSAVKDMRAAHLDAVARALTKADVVVFTLGMTEAWQHHASGTIYPTAPGTIAGRYAPEIFGFREFDYDDLLADFHRINSYLKDLNPALRWILTVSPVPLTATGGENHVLVASTHSKAVLRAACSALAKNDPDIDYFPAFELMTNPAASGSSFDTNLRTPRTGAVSEVMKLFLDAHDLRDETAMDAAQDVPPEEEAACEDALLDRYAP